MTWATSVPILVFLGLSVLDLGPMYVRQHHRFMPPPIRAGIITLHTTNTSRVSVRGANFFIPVRGREGRVKIFLSSSLFTMQNSVGICCIVWAYARGPKNCGGAGVPPLGIWVVRGPLHHSHVHLTMPNLVARSNTYERTENWALASRLSTFKVTQGHRD